MKALIVLPSYNESENILNLIQAILDIDPDYKVCVVDDSSPDGTSQLVRNAIQTKLKWRDRVHLIIRSKKDGRGGAVRVGLAWGVKSGFTFEAYVEMDCDFSHEPSAIPEGFKLLGRGNDAVIGARYPNGTIIGWPRNRRIFSFFANTLARFLIDWSIGDYTNGFRFYSTSAVQVLLNHPQKYKGYIYLSESLSHLLRAGLKVATFPIRFKNRERGVSNTTVWEVCSALQGILLIAWEHYFSQK